MKLAEIIQLYNTVSWMLNSPLPRNTKCNYALLRNKSLLTPMIEDHQQNAKMSIDPDNAALYESARISLIKEHGNLDNAGNPVVNGDNYEIVDEAAYVVAHTAMVEGNPVFKEVVEARAKLEKDAREIEVPFTPYKITIDNMPDNVNPAVLEVLMPLIAD